VCKFPLADRLNKQHGISSSSPKKNSVISLRKTRTIREDGENNFNLMTNRFGRSFWFCLNLLAVSFSSSKHKESLKRVVIFTASGQ